MITATLPPNPTLADRFAWTVGFVLKAVGYEAWRRQLGGPLLGAMTQRIWRLGARFRNAFAQWQAGTLRPPRPRPSRAGVAAPARPDGLANLPPTDWRLLKRLLPRDFGWVKRVLPGIADHFNVFLPLVEDPETQAMLAAAPQVGRILRPLCHTLGLPLPEWLKLPKRPRQPRSRAAASRPRAARPPPGPTLPAAAPAPPSPYGPDGRCRSVPDREITSLFPPLGLAGAPSYPERRTSYDIVFKIRG